MSHVGCRKGLKTILYQNHCYVNDAGLVLNFGILLVSNTHLNGELRFSNVMLGFFSKIDGVGYRISSLVSLEPRSCRHCKQY